MPRTVFARSWCVIKIRTSDTGWENVVYPQHRIHRLCHLPGNGHLVSFRLNGLIELNLWTHLFGFGVKLIPELKLVTLGGALFSTGIGVLKKFGLLGLGSLWWVPTTKLLKIKITIYNNSQHFYT